MHRATSGYAYSSRIFKMNNFLDRFVNKKTQTSVKRYIIAKSTLAEFIDTQTAEKFINTQLEIRKFDLAKPIDIYISESGSDILFEQD